MGRHGAICRTTGPQTYRWGEDGLAGFCDVEQRLCVTLALWNGRDPTPHRG
jgi:hypothetical protein